METFMAACVVREREIDDWRSLQALKEAKLAVYSAVSPGATAREVDAFRECGTWDDSETGDCIQGGFQ